MPSLAFYFLICAKSCYKAALSDFLILWNTAAAYVGITLIHEKSRIIIQLHPIPAASHLELCDYAGPVNEWI